jgi:hypothetical protein
VTWALIARSGLPFKAAARIRIPLASASCVSLYAIDTDYNLYDRANTGHQRPARQGKSGGGDTSHLEAMAWRHLTPSGLDLALMLDLVVQARCTKPGHDKPQSPWVWRYNSGRGTMGSKRSRCKLGMRSSEW